MVPAGLYALLAPLGQGAGLRQHGRSAGPRFFRCATKAGEKLCLRREIIFSLAFKMNVKNDRFCYFLTFRRNPVFLRLLYFENGSITELFTTGYLHTRKTCFILALVT